jgi:YVTN family beta-propeller protein
VLSSQTIYVANSGDNLISVIDGQNNKIEKEIPVGKSPSAIVVDRNTNTIYVANSDDNTVCHISSGTAEIDGTAFTISKVTNDANRNN